MAIGGSVEFSISKKLGERILAEKKLTGEVTKVDFTVEHFRGCETCSWTEYPVTVTYLSQGVEYTCAKTYEGMGRIITELEDIAEEIYD